MLVLAQRAGRSRLFKRHALPQTLSPALDATDYRLGTMCSMTRNRNNGYSYRANPCAAWQVYPAPGRLAGLRARAR